jgi:hypothetical protein
MAISTRTASRRTTHTPADTHACGKPTGRLRLVAIVLGTLGTMAIWHSARAGAAADPAAAPRPIGPPAASAASPAAADKDRGIGGRILDPAGNPARWAVVRVVCADDPSTPHATTASADGSFTFAPLGAKTVRVIAEHESGVVESAAVPADLARHLVLVLEGAPDVRGRVLDDRGRPITKATVKVSPSPAYFERIATTDNRGDYTLRLVPPAATSILVWARGFETATVRLRDVVAGANIRLTRSRPIAGVVVDPWNLPVAGARIEACEGRETEHAISNRDGTFELPATVVDCSVAAVHPRFSASEPFTIRNRGPIAVRMLPGGSIEGMALDEKGRPLSSASIGFESLGGEVADPNLVDRMFDTSGGSFRFDGLSPGTYVLVAKAPDRPDVTSAPIEVDAGQIVRGVPMVFMPTSEPETSSEASDPPPPPPPPESQAS